MNRLIIIYCHIIMYTVHKQLKGGSVEDKMLTNIFNAMLAFACHHYEKKGYTLNDLKSSMKSVLTDAGLGDVFIIDMTCELGVSVYEEYLRNE